MAHPHVDRRPHVTEPVYIEGPPVQLFAFAHLLRGILGSSASNLYLTEIITELIHFALISGQPVISLGLDHSGEVRLAILPEQVATFMFHPKSYAKSDYAVVDFPGKCLRLAQETARRKRWKAGMASDNAVIDEMMTCVLDAWAAFLAAKESVLMAKRNAFWWATLSAWRSHRTRAHSLRTLTRCQNRVFDILRMRCSR